MNDFASNFKQVRRARAGGVKRFNSTLTTYVRPPRATKPIAKVSAKQRRKNAQWTAIGKELDAECGGRCMIGVPNICEGKATGTHHKLGKGVGGKNEKSNGLRSCWPCHRYAETHQTEAVAKGWTVERRSMNQTADPIEKMIGDLGPALDIVTAEKEINLLTAENIDRHEPNIVKRFVYIRSEMARIEKLFADRIRSIRGLQ